MTQMLASEVLQAAMDKIATPERWIKGAMARDAAGDDVYEWDPDAVCWCAYGAILSVASGGMTYDYSTAVARQAGWFWISEWNDFKKTTHADVMAAFGKAIAAAKRKEAAQ